MKPAQQSGFSVIEALIAVAMIAMALLPIVTLETQLVRRQAAQKGMHAALSAQRNALAALRDMNVSQSPNGSRALGAEAIMTWRATPISAPTRSLQSGNGEGPFEVVLWRVEIEIRDGTGNIIRTFTIDKLGWRQLSVGSTDG